MSAGVITLTAGEVRVDEQHAAVLELDEIPFAVAWIAGPRRKPQHAPGFLRFGLQGRTQKFREAQRQADQDQQVEPRA